MFLLKFCWFYFWYSWICSHDFVCYGICSNVLKCLFLHYSSSPRKYDRAKEKLRNKKRALAAKLKDYKSQTQAETAKLKRQILDLNRQLAQAAKFTSQVKQKFDKMTPRQKATVYRQCASPTKVKTGKAVTTFANVLGMSRKAIRSNNKGNSTAKKRVAKKILRVTQFLCDPQWSITMPGKKDVVSCRYEVYDGNNRKHIIRKMMPKVQLTENISDLHKIYQEQNKDLPVCLTFFKNVRARSQYIRLLDQSKPEVCLCQRHQNFSLKMRALRKYNRDKDNPVSVIPDTIVRKYDVKAFDELVDKIKPNLPNDVVFQEWRNVFVPVDDPKVLQCSITQS